MLDPIELRAMVRYAKRPIPYYNSREPWSIKAVNVFAAARALADQKRVALFQRILADGSFQYEAHKATPDCIDRLDRAARRFKLKELYISLGV